MRKKISQKGFSFAEVSIVIALLAIIGIRVLGLIYRTDINKWEDNLCRSVGLEPVIADVAIGILALVYFVARAMISLRRRCS